MRRAGRAHAGPSLRPPVRKPRLMLRPTAFGARLGKAAATDARVEIKFSIPDNWSRQLFIALCRRYGISPFRYRRMHRQTVIVKAPRSFVEQVLWPKFQELSTALTAYLADITQR